MNEEREPCKACGLAHPPGPVGEPGTAFAGIEILTCPNLPRKGIYLDREHEHGPRGELHILDSD